MNSRVIIHQWRDWILEHIADNDYQLIRRIDKSVHPFTAKDSIDAENISRQLIKETGEGVRSTPA